MKNTLGNYSVRALLAAGAVFAGHAASAQFELILIGETSAPGDRATEIVAYDPVTNRIFSTSGDGLDAYDFGVGSNITPVDFFDYTGSFGGTLDSVSSVAVDPLGRGFGAATLIPNANTTSLGEVVLFDTTTGAVLNRVNAGFNPDMVTFTADGNSVLIANEGEASTDGTEDPDGGLGILDLAGQSYATLGTLTNSNMSNFNFAPALLDNPSDLSGLRVDPANQFSIPIDLEPEYISVSNGKAYVTLQENSAVGVFDLTSKRWEKIHNIGGLVQTVDASDRDDAIAIDDAVFGLFMPDAIATYQVAGTTYFVTANEGDARDGVDGEESRIKDLPLSAFDAALVVSLNNIYDGDFQADEALGRLRITTIDGDTDNDGDIDRLTMYGTRSFSIFNGETGDIVFDSGSDFETITAAVLPDAFNSEDSSADEFDGRSDNKGPEPEGVAITTIDGTVLAAIGLERVGGIMLYDITDPASAEFLQYINTADFELGKKIGPEGLTWLEKDGENFLVVSYEDTGDIDVFSVAVPEPGSLALLGLGGLLIVRRRRA